jgi:hypothetical protein
MGKGSFCNQEIIFRRPDFVVLATIAKTMFRALQATVFGMPVSSVFNVMQSCQFLVFAAA